MVRKDETLLEKLLSVGRECPWIEYKHNNTKPELIGGYISGLANSAPLHCKDKGYIVWGIEDKTLHIKGTNFKPHETKKGNEPLINWLTRLLKPHVDFKIRCFDYDQKHWWFAKVFEMGTIPVMQPCRFCQNVCYPQWV